MRRWIAVAVVSGLVLGVAAAEPALAGSAAGGVKSKIISYGGYELSVPADWPVYRLDRDPTRCVRYDVHAVYLGTPGASQRCPAGLIGRTQTVSVIPGAVAAAGPEGVTYQRAQPGVTGGTQVKTLPAVGAAIVQNGQLHEFRMTLGAPRGGATVVATYGDKPAAAEQVLTSLRHVPMAQSVARPAAAQSVTQPTARPSATTGWHGLPDGWPAETIAPSPSPSPPPPVKPPPPPVKPKPKPKPAPPKPGFDTCTAPSLAAMRAWRRAYAVAGVYIGGANAACDYGNLSATWISSTAAMGWSTLPTYVGLQAPCYGYGSMINPKKAVSQGRAAADDAIRDAAMFGMGKGAPVYFDMEAYKENNASCVSAVLTFLGAWTRELNARGYLSGVYSSKDSGIADLQYGKTRKVAGFTAPQAIWIGHWDGKRSLSEGNLAWPLSARSKQYLGPRWQKVGGISLNIDTDLVGGPTAR
jgi:hypothetical protein